MEDRRALFRKGLSSLYLPIYDALCAELSASWQPYWGLRTIGQQDQLFAQGRTLPGKKVTNARGGESAHNYGCATDWTFWVGSKAIWLEEADPEWKEYRDACTKLGLTWGGTFPKPDLYHNELTLSIPYKQIGIVFNTDGLPAALELLKASAKC